MGGVLFIIKDADAGDEQEDEGAFGAWIADGEGLGAGKKGGKGYFGGGESYVFIPPASIHVTLKKLTSIIYPASYGNSLKEG